MTLDPSAVWSSCLEIIKKSIENQPFKTWFAPIKPIMVKDSVLTIQVPNKFFYEWLEEHYVDVMKRAIKQVLGASGSLEYQIMVENYKRIGNSQSHSTAASLNVNNFNEDKIINPFVIPGIKKLKIDSQLSDKYTLENFVIGECNKFPFSAGNTIAKKPGGTAFNPMVIYGDVGLGKTHLAQAIGNKVLENFETKNVLYITVEKFTNQVIHAIKSQNVNDFMNFYQMIDVLIVDDIQFLAGRSKTQEIFFNIFNQLHQLGKQIILTSDRAPKDLADVDERLISRFKWGLAAELSAPDFDTRMKILDFKLNNENLDLPIELKTYICTHIRNNIRELEGVVISLVAQAMLNKTEISMKLVQSVIAQFVTQDNQEISIESIKQLVAKHFDLTVDKLQSKTRLREVVVARQLSMYIAKNFTDSSLKSIGESFGGRDHTTVLHSLKTVQDMMDTDELFKDKVEVLVRKVQSTLVNI